MASSEYWRKELLEMFLTSRANAFRSLEAARDYFGHKIGFYLGFAAFYNSFLFGPTFSGAVAFGIEFISQKFKAQTAPTVESAAMFKDR
jgi:hypothetical protein